MQRNGVGAEAGLDKCRHHRQPNKKKQKNILFVKVQKQCLYMPRLQHCTEATVVATVNAICCPHKLKHNQRTEAGGQTPFTKTPVVCHAVSLRCVFPVQLPALNSCPHSLARAKRFKDCCKPSLLMFLDLILLADQRLPLPEREREREEEESRLVETPKNSHHTRPLHSSTVSLPTRTHIILAPGPDRVE